MSYVLIALIISSLIIWFITNWTNNKKTDDPLWDGTDYAHPAWHRGVKFSFWETSRIITEVLDGENDCSGRMGEPFETMRNRVYKLKQEWDKLAHNEETLLNKINEWGYLQQRLQKQFESLTKTGNIAWDMVYKLKAEKEKLKSKKHITLTQAREMALFTVERSKERQKWQNAQETITKLQEKLDKHTKYEGGVSVECGHPEQCAYACAKVDGGPVRCSMCDLKGERDRAILAKENLERKIMGI